MRKLSLLIIFGVLLTGCSVNEVITAEETELIVAEAPPDESMLLDIGIIQFADGVITILRSVGFDYAEGGRTTDVIATGEYCSRTRHPCQRYYHY